MSFINKIIGGAGGGLIKSLGTVADKFITTGAEKEEFKQEMTRLVQGYHARAQEQLTDRLRIDMSSDSWLSKNIRPLTLIFILVTYTLFSVTDENIVFADQVFDINESYVELLGEWGSYIMAFYFGGRSIEKIAQVWKGGGK